MIGYFQGEVITHRIVFPLANPILDYTLKRPNLVAILSQVYIYSQNADSVQILIDNINLTDIGVINIYPNIPIDLRPDLKIKGDSRIIANSTILGGTAIIIIVHYTGESIK